MSKHGLVPQQPHKKSISRGKVGKQTYIRKRHYSRVCVSMLQSSFLLQRVSSSLLRTPCTNLPIQQTMQRLPIFVSLLFIFARSTSAFTVHSSTSRLSTALFSTIPEPGPCPSCNDDNAYWDGSTLFVCTACAYEWPVNGDINKEDDTNTADVTRDSNGFILQSGDTCVLIKDLAKGKLKKGLKVKIRLGDYGDGHDCEASITGSGTYALKSEFLKKV